MSSVEHGHKQSLRPLTPCEKPKLFESAFTSKQQMLRRRLYELSGMKWGCGGFSFNSMFYLFPCAISRLKLNFSPRIIAHHMQQNVTRVSVSIDLTSIPLNNHIYQPLCDFQDSFWMRFLRYNYSRERASLTGKCHGIGEMIVIWTAWLGRVLFSIVSRHNNTRLITQ